MGRSRDNWSEAGESKTTTVIGNHCDLKPNADDQARTKVPASRTGLRNGTGRGSIDEPFSHRSHKKADQLLSWSAFF